LRWRHVQEYLGIGGVGPKSEIQRPKFERGLKRSVVSAIVSDMNVTKTITVRELKRGTPEETLGPGQALRVKKSSGKEFLLVRETETPDLAALHKEIMQDIPLTGPSQKTDLAAWHQEDEE
jgi:hypothetical protein